MGPLLSGRKHNHTSTFVLVSSRNFFDQNSITVVTAATDCTISNHSVAHTNSSDQVCSVMMTHNSKQEWKLSGGVHSIKVKLNPCMPWKWANFCLLSITLFQEVEVPFPPRLPAWPDKSLESFNVNGCVQISTRLYLLQHHYSRSRTSGHG